MIQKLELRLLCSLILERTINDPDKYQSGLTKIFFRAGMLAALESLRSERLNALVTIVQKNMRRRMAVKKYQELRSATIKIQTWWRGILARRLVESIRRNVAAKRLQAGVRCFLQRSKFLQVRQSVIALQSRKFWRSQRRFSLLMHGTFRHPWCTSTASEQGGEDTAWSCAVAIPVPRIVSSLFFRFVQHTDGTLYRLYRRSYRSDFRHVVYLQSCVRRRLAKKQLKILKAEARSVSKFKEISYRLENKVVELTQTLQKRTEEKKALQAQLEELEKQIQQWSSKHEEADTKAKSFQTALQTAEAELSRREELLQAKADVEKRLEDAIAKAAEKEEAIQRLTNEVIAQAAQLQSQEKAFAASPMRSTDDVSVIATLKSEVSSLREQLNRANAYNALTRGAREPPTSPTFVPALRIPDANGALGLSLAPPLHPNPHQRRHSTAGVLQLSPSEYRTSADELMIDVKRSQALNQRAVSVAYNGEDNGLRVRTNGVADLRSYDDLAEEKIRLMQDIKRLDEDVLIGLIRGLKIPAPSTTNPSAVKEILFPANLISLVTNEMWKYGLIPESERFLANVMEAIQAHVMVSSLPCLLDAF